MITFEVWINGQRLTVAGISQISVLSAIVTAVGQLGPDSAETTCPPNVGVASTGTTTWLAQRLRTIGAVTSYETSPCNSTLRHVFCLQSDDAQRNPRAHDRRSVTAGTSWSGARCSP